jgi:hypothetical protein
MNRLEEIAAQLEKLQASVDKKRDPWGWFKDVLIPVAGVLLAIMGFIANSDANRRQELEAKAAREQKYLEYFLENYSDASPTKQTSAFALLKYMNPEVRKDLVFGLSASADLSREAWQVLIGLENVTLNFSAANAYRVEIYYGKEQEAMARAIEKQLKAAGFLGQIELGEKVPAFWDRYGWGQGNEIRFEPKTDAAAMRYLYRFIDAKNPGLEFRETPVQDTSRPNSIAVHLPPRRG